ncbi:MAG: cobalamin-dependent protein [Candidatus Omnitrophica bacterium]|nr:cobalamin-dependent protein [Candidatus Omnitrophota bacterium]
MNILLANMPIQFNSQENLEPPLGIVYIAGVLEKNGKNVYLKDFEVENFSESILEEIIKKYNIDLVGISFRTASYGSAKKFANLLKKINRNIKIVIGGHHTTAFPESTLIDIECDIAVRGEGEYAFLDIVNALEKDKSLQGIEGISFKYNGRIFYNPERKPIDNLDLLPFPARHLLAIDKYTVMTILTSRGCPFSCIYCDKGVSGKKVSLRSPENVYQEILDIAKRFRKKRLYIVDDFFFLNKQRVNKLLDMIIDNENLRVNWICQARVDGVNKQLLKKAKKSGCSQIIYGVETGDKEELEYIKKQTTIEQAEEAIRLTKKVGITARTNFMLGFPISTHKSIENTIKFAKRISPDLVRFFSVSPLPNTELWNYIYGEKTDLRNFNWDEFDFYNPDFAPHQLTKDNITIYAIFGYSYTLGKRTISEIVIGLIPNLARLFLSILKSGRIRGNISLHFPVTVNLFLDTWRLIKNKKLREKINLIYRAISIKNKFREK